MNTPIRLGLYGAGLAVIFVVAFVGAGIVIPDERAASWNETVSGHAGHESESESGSGSVPGLSSEQDGYRLTDVTAPGGVGQEGTLAFRLTGPGGHGVQDYTTSHEKDLHLIVVRSDGAYFRHVHPTTSGDGYWSIPWSWQAAGSYRVFTDVVPAALGANLTLTSTVSVAGELTPRLTPEPTTVAAADDYTVSIDGDLEAGADTELTFRISRDGVPVTNLEPYLGAYGHLVALRSSDLAYLHVHPVESGEAGPDITFMADAPTTGTYFLYLDFRADGRLHTAEFTVDAAAADGTDSGH